MTIKTLDDLLAEGVTGRRVLVRADLNVPFDKEPARRHLRRRPDPSRAADPATLRDNGARVVVMSHLGRPKGAPDPKYSLAPVAQRMTELLGTPVGVRHRHGR